MEQIKNVHYEGERPLFATRDLYLENVTIHTGESALKECKNIEAVTCRFEGKYPFGIMTVCREELLLYRGGACRSVVFQRFANDGYDGGSSENVP